MCVCVGGVILDPWLGRGWEDRRREALSWEPIGYLGLPARELRQAGSQRKGFGHLSTDPTHTPASRQLGTPHTPKLPLLQGLGQLPPPAASPQRPGRGAQQKLREKSNAARTATGCQRRAHFLNLLPAATERRNTDSARSRGQAPALGCPGLRLGRRNGKKRRKREEDGGGAEEKQRGMQNGNVDWRKGKESG